MTQLSADHRRRASIGGVLAWISGKRVAMTDMPQMIALYNGMGGGAAAAIARGGAVSRRRSTSIARPGHRWRVVGGFIGAVSFSGSLIAFGKLQGLITQVAALRRPAGRSTC